MPRAAEPLALVGDHVAAQEDEYCMRSTAKWSAHSLCGMRVP